MLASGAFCESALGDFCDFIFGLFGFVGPVHPSIFPCSSRRSLGSFPFFTDLGSLTSLGAF